LRAGRREERAIALKKLVAALRQKISAASGMRSYEISPLALRERLIKCRPRASGDPVVVD